VVPCATGEVTGRDGRAVYSTGTPSPPRTLIDIFECTALTFPAAPALDDGQSTLDYSGLRREVEQFADRLRADGIGAGDRVGVRTASGTADLYVSILAVLAVGAAYVPVDVDDPDERAELVWSQAAVCAVIADNREVRHPTPPGRQADPGGGPGPGVGLGMQAGVSSQRRHCRQQR
jgi:non-ribosomal peptide synthetase component F